MTARAELIASVRRVGTVNYGEVRDAALLNPLGWEADVESRVREPVAAGEVVIQGMGPRERKPKPHHMLRHTSGST